MGDDTWDPPKSFETALDGVLSESPPEAVSDQESLVNREDWEEFGRKIDKLSVSEKYKGELKSEIGKIVESNDIDGVLNHSRNAAMRVLCGYIVEADAHLNERTEKIPLEIRQGFRARESFMKKVRKADVTVDALGNDLRTSKVKVYDGPKKKEIPLMRAFGWEDAKNPIRKMQPLVSDSSIWMKKTKKREGERIKRHLATLLDSLVDFVQAAEDAIKNRNPE